MADFLEPANACGQNLLRLVSRGNAIVAELLRLSDIIPPVFRQEESRSKYGDIVFDLSYFKNLDAIERKIEANAGIQEKDDEFRENFIDVVTRFYLAFESIHKYTVDLNRFLEDLEEGLYIQQTIESVLLNGDGKQLLCESLFLCGVMLLVVDQKINGQVRERILVSYYRYSAQRSTSDSNIDDVCNLLRSTSYSSSGKRPPNYPEDYFKRVRINSLFVNMVIGRLRSDDVYNQIAAYPFPEHRSIAMSTQASMLYVVLYFAPDMLNNQQAVMREIVDKFFPDNWIVSIYMGMIVNLVEAWEPYRSAKQALNNTLEANNIKDHANKHNSRMIKLLPQVQNLLKEGVLTEEMVLDSTSKLMNIIRECNVTLRWLMLQTAPSSQNELTSIVSKRCKQLRDAVVAESSYDALMLQVFRLLLYTSQLELRVKEIYQQLLNQKEEKWEKYKKESHERVTELSEVFSGEKLLTRVVKNTNLENWFKEIGKQIDSLAYDSTSVSTRKLVQIIEALEEAQEFNQLESNLQVKQYLTETKKYLHCMLKTIGVKEEVLITLQIVGDLAYAWEIIDNYTKYMQQGIKKDPTLVIKLRATFLSLGSALDIPLMRINQSGSPDLVSVSQYYSSELVSYVRKVLHIIPETMFALMARIIELQTNNIKELPTRLMKDQLKQYAQLEERKEVAQLTHSISVFTEGILMMKTTLVGIIQIDPKRLLEDGIRKELVRQVAAALHKGLVFNPKAKTSEFVPRLEALSQIMDGFRRSFEYIQDYVCIYGLKIWQEEVARIVNFNIEQECNAFMRQKVFDWESVYQSKAIPIPKYPPLDPYSINFIGRLARELLRITDPKATVYVHQMSTWYDIRTHQEVVNSRLFTLMMKSIGTAGVNGLDRLLSFMILTELQNITKYIEKNILKDATWMDTLTSFNSALDNLDNDGLIGQSSAKVYTPVLAKAARAWPMLNEAIMRVGQMQVIRACISHELNTSCKFESRHLASTLQTFNDALLNELEKNPSKLTSRDDSPLLFELTNYLEWTGISDPLSKVYIVSKPPNFLSVIAFILTLLQMPKFVYIKNIHGLTGKRGADSSDGTPFTIGMLTWLRQFHEDNMRKLLSRCCQYINSLIETGTSSGMKMNEIPSEVFSLLAFNEQFIRLGKMPSSFVSQVPSYLLDQFYSLNPNR